MCLFNKVVNKEVVRQANLRIVNTVYVPMETVLVPDLLTGLDFKTAIIPPICDITFEYDGDEYVLSGETKFYLEFLKDKDEEISKGNLFLQHDIVIKTYKNGKKVIELYKDGCKYKCNNRY